MSKLMSLIRRAPKRFSAVVAMVAAAVIIPAVVFAWGPSRETFTLENPSDHVQFNSITNNPNIGDERNFVGIREVGSSNVWYDNMSVQEGKEYFVRMYVHNNAASSLNLTAENVTAKFNLPTTTGKSIQVNGFLSASNVGADKNGNKGSFAEVYDHATFTGDRDFNLAYVSGSLKYENNVFGPNGVALPESIFTSAGAKLGYSKLDGKIPGCFQYDGYVTFKVKPQIAKTLDFTLKKLVSKHGANQWVENYKAQPGEKVDFILNYKNTGTAQNDDVTFRDTLPTGLSYVAKSGTWSNARTQNVAFTNDAALTNGTGVNVGSYLPGTNAYTIFTAQVAENDKLPKCGTNTLVNKGKVNTGGYAVEDTASVTVDKHCKPAAKYTCDTLNVSQLSRTTFRFTTDYTVENATFKSVTYTVRNASGAVVHTQTVNGRTLDYTQTTPGAFTVQSAVTVTVDGQDKTVTSDKCKGSFKVEKEKEYKYTCNALEITKLSRSEFRFAVAYTVENATFKSVTYVVRDATGAVVDTITGTTNTSNYTQTQAGAYSVQATITFMVNGEEKTATSNKCKGSFEVKDLPKEITVCELKTKKIITIKESDFDSSKHSKDLDDCKEVVKKIEVCDLKTKKIVTINEDDFDSSKYTKDLSKCEETPEVPPELPQTGAGEGIVAVAGLGALIASIAYYVASRRALGL